MRSCRLLVSAAVIFFSLVHRRKQFRDLRVRSFLEFYPTLSELFFARRSRRNSINDFYLSSGIKYAACSNWFRVSLNITAKPSFVKITATTRELAIRILSLTDLTKRSVNSVKLAVKCSSVRLKIGIKQAAAFREFLGRKTTVESGNIRI